MTCAICKGTGVVPGGGTMWMTPDGPDDDFEDQQACPVCGPPEKRPTAEELTREFLDAIPLDWRYMVGELTEEQLLAVSRYAAGLALAAAELSAYVTMRGGSGCDHGNEKAWKHALDMRRKVRNVLGYVSPWM